MSVPIPRELNYSMPAPLEGLKSYELRQPTYTALTAFSGPNSVAQINLPQMPNTWLDPSSTWISMEVTISLTKGANNYDPGTDIGQFNAALLGSGLWSLFNRVQVFGNGIPIEDVISPNLFVNDYRNLSQSNPEKQGDALAFGGQDIAAITAPNVAAILGGPVTSNYAFSTAPAAAVQQQTLRFAAPMIGLLGSGSSKLIPLFVVSHRIDLSLEALSNVIVTLTGGAAFAADPVASMTVNRLEFVGTAITLSDRLMTDVMGSLPVPGQIAIRCNQVSTTQVVVPQGNAGSNQYQVGTRVSSCKAMLCHYQTAGCIDKIFGSVNPNLAQYAHEINGILYPQQMADCTKIADVWGRNLQALGVWSTTNGKPCFGLSSFAVSQTAAQPSTPWLGKYDTLASLRAYAPGTPIGGRSNCFLTFMDLEVFGQKASGSSFFSGISTIGGANFLRLNFAVPTAATCTIVCFTMHDAIITYDAAAGTVYRKI